MPSAPGQLTQAKPPTPVGIAGSTRLPQRRNVVDVDVKCDRHRRAYISVPMSNFMPVQTVRMHGSGMPKRSCRRCRSDRSFPDR